MKFVVVYESMFGNTHIIATAIGRGLDHAGEVYVVPVGQANKEMLEGVDLLVVGGPTHVHGMSRASTRTAAAEEADSDDAVELDPDAPGEGLRTWLDALPRANDIHSAAFDTRIDKPVLLVGSAAKGIGKRLRRRGYARALDPESFFVDASHGPLHEGEEDRAQHWGTDLAHELQRLARQRVPQQGH